MIKAIIFDFDGTLVDSVKSIWKEYRRVMSIMGLRKVTYREFTRHLGRPWDQVLKSMWPDVDIKEFNSHYKLDAETVKPIKDVSTALEKLNGKYALAILTSRGEHSLKIHMQNAGLKPGLFQAIQHKDNLKNHKPHPDAIKDTCSKLGVAIGEVVYVGDSIIDAECAKSAHAKFIGVLSGSASEKEFKACGADYIIKTMAELPVLLSLMR